ncbi:MAG: lamin tail domain-containing protein [Anaerolineales bacterium]|nr:lamin tail domain-containing protein [Anaerolineales bacterium]
MKPSKRLIFYLLLNLVVSACTTLTVLVVWDQFRGPLPMGLLPTAVSNLTRTKTPTPQVVQTGTVVIAPTATEVFLVYQVQSGDTFDSIADQYNVSVEELLAINGFTRSQPLGSGEILRIPVHPKGGVYIDSVIGAGDLASERIMLRHRGEGELSLVGWRIEDGQGNVFIFPQFPHLTLYHGGGVNVYTKTGNNSVVEMFWGLNQSIWRSGMVVTLRDPQGTVRASYTVP